MSEPKISVMYVNKKDELHVSFTPNHAPMVHEKQLVTLVTSSCNVLITGSVVRRTKRGINLTNWHIYEP